MRDRRRVLIGLALGALVMLCLTGCFGSSDDSGAKELSKQEELRQAREQGARDQRIKQLEREVNQQQKGKGNGGGGGTSSKGGGSSGGGSGGATSGSSSCGGGLSVGPNTSCAFARNVQSAFDGSGPGSVSVFSPTTGRTYEMTCTSSPHRCTGGNNATVYFP